MVLWIGLLNTYLTAGLRRGTTTSLQQTWGHRPNGPLPAKARVLACTANPVCVRIDHLRLDGARETNPTRRARARKGTGSMRLIRPGTWELRVTIGRWADGRPRTLNCTVYANGEPEAAAQLVTFVDEMSRAQLPDSQEGRDVTVDEAIERFLRSIWPKRRAAPTRPLRTTAICTSDGSAPSSAPGLSSASRVPLWTTCSVRWRLCRFLLKFSGGHSSFRPLPDRTLRV